MRGSGFFMFTYEDTYKHLWVTKEVYVLPIENFSSMDVLFMKCGISSICKRLL